MNTTEFGMFLGNIPMIVSNTFYNYMGEKNRKPRFETVFKMVKEEIKYEGYDFKTLPKNQQNEIEEMARDAFEGMRDAGF